MPEALWVSPAVPADIFEITKSWDIPLTDDPALATQKLDVSNTSQGSMWIYALVAPFPTVTDDVTSQDLLSAWKGDPAPPIAGHAILLAESTLGAFTALWGEPASGVVRVVPSDQIIRYSVESVCVGDHPVRRNPAKMESVERGWSISHP